MIIACNIKKDEAGESGKEIKIKRNFIGKYNKELNSKLDFTNSLIRIEKPNYVVSVVTLLCVIILNRQMFDILKFHGVFIL